jgi:hypothetical protein
MAGDAPSAIAERLRAQPEAVLGVTELPVIGSQAVHGSMSGPLSIEAARSVDVDVAVRGDVEGRLTDLIEGPIGEASTFSLRLLRPCRTNSGKVIRWSIFSWDSAKYRDYLVINGTTYSPPKR